MIKTKPSKKLNCPAYKHEKIPVQGGFKVVHVMCTVFFDLTKTESLEAQGQLISHLRTFHNFYWKRHGKKLETRFSKQRAMRNK